MLIPILLTAVGLLLLIRGDLISRWKTEGWAAFYSRNPHAATANPLSKYAGSQTSVRVGAIFWRLIGAMLLFVGLIQLLAATQK